MITSASNSRIKGLVQLSQKAKVRKEQDSFLVEGIKMFLEAPDERIREIYVSESFFSKCTCQEKIKRNHYEIVADDIFKKISSTMTPQGILCVMKQYHYQLDEFFKKETPFLMLLEDIQDPGNLGTIIRTGEGAGIDGVIMSRETVDLYNPKTIRSTMGSIYRVPFLYVDQLSSIIAMLKDKKITTYAAHLQGTKYYDEFNYCKGTAFLIGNEGNGLKEETAKLADDYMKIPMEGKVESLNAAIASSILMYETQRQRRM